MEVKTISGGALWSHSLLPGLGSLAQTDATSQAGRATPSTALLKPCSFSSPFSASVLPSTLCIQRAVLFLHLPFPLHFKFLNLAHKSLLDLTPAPFSSFILCQSHFFLPPWNVSGFLPILGPQPTLWPLPGAQLPPPPES